MFTIQHLPRKIVSSNSNLTSSRTSCVHLYNEILRAIDIDKIDENCILARMFKNEI